MANLVAMLLLILERIGPVFNSSFYFVRGKLMAENGPGCLKKYNDFLLLNCDRLL